MENLEKISLIEKKITKEQEKLFKNELNNKLREIIEIFEKYLKTSNPEFAQDFYKFYTNRWHDLPAWEMNQLKEKAIKEFMEKIDNLNSSYEELRDSINFEQEE